MTFEMTDSAFMLFTLALEVVDRGHQNQYEHYHSIGMVEGMLYAVGFIDPFDRDDSRNVQDKLWFLTYHRKETRRERLLRIGRAFIESRKANC